MKAPVGSVCVSSASRRRITVWRLVLCLRASTDKGSPPRKPASTESRVAGSSEVDAAEHQAVHPHPHVGEPSHGRAHVDGIATQPVEPGDDEHVTALHPVKQAGEAAAPRHRLTAGHGLADHPVRLHHEPRGRDLANLVLGGLAGGGDPGMGGGARQGSDPFTKDVRIVAPLETWSS